MILKCEVRTNLIICVDWNGLTGVAVVSAGFSDLRADEKRYLILISFPKSVFCHFGNEIEMCEGIKKTIFFKKIQTFFEVCRLTI